MFVEVEMLVYSFLKANFMIGKYLIFNDFYKAYEFTFTSEN